MKRRIGIFLAAMLFVFALVPSASASGVVPKPNNGYVVAPPAVADAEVDAARFTPPRGGLSHWKKREVRRRIA